MTFEAKFDDAGMPVVQYEVVAPFTFASGRTCPEARLGFCVFAEKPNLPIVILHPALTGTPRAWANRKGSQGDGWLSRCIGKGKFLDPDEFTIICVDPLGGNGFSSSADELAEFKDSLQLVDGIALIAEILRRRGINEIHAAIGGSIGGGQAVEWLFQNHIRVKKIFDVSGSACRTRCAIEFFQIQADLLSGTAYHLEDIENRLTKNCADLNGTTEAFDFVFKIVIRNLRTVINSFSKDLALKVSRQIGFLRFVTPIFFEERLNLYREENPSDIAALQSLESWIEYQGEVFLKRFSPTALEQLCAMDARATFRSPEIVAEAIQLKNVELIGFSVKGDVLFPYKPQRGFYELVSACLPSERQKNVAFISVEDKVNGHDHFLTEYFAKSSLELKEKL